jgi:hypothetical protein
MQRLYRPLLLAVAVGTLAAGIVVFFVGSRGANALVDSYDSYTIEINATGFNPPLCIVHRSDQIKFFNADSKRRRIIVPNAGVDAIPLFDSGYIEPGVTNPGIVLNANTRWDYQDFDDPKLKGIIQNTDTGPAVCALVPPTATPTLTPTATPTGPPRPPFCRGNLIVCALIPALARE